MYKRCGVVTDRYFPDSLKENLRKIRGLGTTIVFSGETKLPSDFIDFLGNSGNKSNLNEFLVKPFLEEHVNTQSLVITYKDTIFSNQECLHYDEDILNCSIEETDQRLVRHAYNCVRK